MKKATAKKIGLNAVLLIVLYIFQAFVFSRAPIMGVKPLIIPVAVIGAGFFGGGVSGGVFGIFAGLLCDAAFNSSVLFTSALPLLGLASGLVSEYLLLPRLFSYLLSSLFGLLAVAFLQTFPLLAFQRADILAVGRVSLLQTAYSLIFVFALYYPIRLIFNRGN